MSEVKPEKTGRLRRLFVFLLQHTGGAAATLFIVGLLFQVIIRDRIPMFGFIFYALPRPLLLAIGAIAAAAFLCQRKLKTAGIAGLAVLLVGIWWSATCCNIGSGVVAEKPTLRVFFWNTMRNRKKFDEILQLVEEEGADIVGMVEAPYEPTGWSSALPGYETVGNESLKLFVRGTILDSEAREVLDVVRIHRHGVKVGGGTYQVFLVDINANPFHDRSRAFAELKSMLARYRGMPIIVMGDFNTPMESVHFEFMQDEFCPAYPRGFRETWPVIAPVLSLDQIWTSHDLTTLQSRKIYTMSSDHVALLADMTTTPTQGDKND